MIFLVYNVRTSGSIRKNGDQVAWKGSELPETVSEFMRAPVSPIWSIISYLLGTIGKHAEYKNGRGGELTLVENCLRMDHLDGGNWHDQFFHNSYYQFYPTLEFKKPI